MTITPIWWSETVQWYKENNAVVVTWIVDEAKAKGYRTALPKDSLGSADQLLRQVLYLRSHYQWYGIPVPADVLAAAKATIKGRSRCDDWMRRELQGQLGQGMWDVDGESKNARHKYYTDKLREIVDILQFSPLPILRSKRTHGNRKQLCHIRKLGSTCVPRRMV